MTKFCRFSANMPHILQFFLHIRKIKFRQIYTCSASAKLNSAKLNSFCKCHHFGPKMTKFCHFSGNMPYILQLFLHIRQIKFRQIYIFSASAKLNSAKPAKFSSRQNFFRPKFLPLWYITHSYSLPVIILLYLKYLYFKTCTNTLQYFITIRTVIS